MTAEGKRRWRAANRAKDLEYKRRYHAANRARELEYKRRYREANPDAHGCPAGELRAGMWQAQGPHCYLCGEDLTLPAAVIDHDHRCCPYGRSCALCRRGLACNRCNVLIGLAADNPDLLRRIAASLEVACSVVGTRMGKKAQQLTFDGAGDTM